MRLTISTTYRSWNWNGFKICWNVFSEHNDIPILLIHGFGASSLHWRKNIKSFSENGYAVYIIDLLGFGNSDQPGIDQVGQLDNGVWSDQITDFIHEIIRPINSNKIIIIGNSLGGLVALTCAVLIPEEIAGIVASPLPDPISMVAVKENLNSKLSNLKFKTINLLIKILPLHIILFFITKFGIIYLGLNAAYHKKESIDQTLIQLIKKPAQRSTASKALKSMCLGMSLRSDKLKASFLLNCLNKQRNVPFLLIWGEKDNFIPLFFGKRITKIYQWVKLIVIANSGHCVHDEDHYKFNEIVHEWIKDLKAF